MINWSDVPDEVLREGLKAAGLVTHTRDRNLLLKLSKGMTSTTEGPLLLQKIKDLRPIAFTAAPV